MIGADTNIGTDNVQGVEEIAGDLEVEIEAGQEETETDQEEIEVDQEIEIEVDQGIEIEVGDIEDIEDIEEIIIKY